MSDRVAVDAGVKAEIAKDLASPYSPHESLSGRTCLDGRPVDGFQGDIVELWSNLECPFCGIQEPLQAQRDNPGLCIVVRHIPSDEYGESLKKALSYEALKTFSVNAAHRFWDAVLPKTSLGIPVPYEAALQTAIQEAAIAPDAFADALQAAAPLGGRGYCRGAVPYHFHADMDSGRYPLPACDLQGDGTSRSSETGPQDPLRGHGRTGACGGNHNARPAERAAYLRGNA